jgi:hypothetical protein
MGREHVLIAFLRSVRKISKSDYKLRYIYLSVRPSIRLSAWNNSAPTVRIWTKFGIISIFRKFVMKIKVLLKYVKNYRYFTQRPLYIYGNISLIYF